MILRKELNLGTHAWGEASVLKTGIALIYQGYAVFKPLVDDHGVDLAIVGSHRTAKIQVKSASLATKKKTETSSTSYYEFSLTSVKARFSGGAEISTRIFSEEVDFVVLHGVDEDRFWVVPAAFLDGRKSVSVYTTNRSRLDIDWDDLKRRREDGETFRSLGDSVGISAPAVYERLSGISKAAGSKIANPMRGFENDWESIKQFLEASTANNGGG